MGRKNENGTEIPEYVRKWADEHNVEVEVNVGKRKGAKKIVGLLLAVIVIGSFVWFIPQILSSINDPTIYAKGFADGNSKGLADGNLSGYSMGYAAGFTARGFNVRDPTYAEAISFICDDGTNRHDYTDDYVCWNFAGDFKLNAFKKGYRCGFVFLDWVDGAHALNCFNTTDRGVIYVEPQDDKLMSLAVGKHYWSSNDIVLYDDRILTWMIIW